MLNELISQMALSEQGALGVYVALRAELGGFAGTLDSVTITEITRLCAKRGLALSETQIRNRLKTLVSRGVIRVEKTELVGRYDVEIVPSNEVGDVDVATALKKKLNEGCGFGGYGVPDFFNNLEYVFESEDTSYLWDDPAFVEDIRQYEALRREEEYEAELRAQEEREAKKREEEREVKKTERAETKKAKAAKSAKANERPKAKAKAKTAKKERTPVPETVPTSEPRPNEPPAQEEEKSEPKTQTAPKPSTDDVRKHVDFSNEDVAKYRRSVSKALWCPTLNADLIDRIVGVAVLHLGGMGTKTLSGVIRKAIEESEKTRSASFRPFEPAWRFITPQIKRYYEGAGWEWTPTRNIQEPKDDAAFLPPAKEASKRDDDSEPVQPSPPVPNESTSAAPTVNVPVAPIEPPPTPKPRVVPTNEIKPDGVSFGDLRIGATLIGQSSTERDNTALDDGLGERSVEDLANSIKDFRRVKRPQLFKRREKTLNELESDACGLTLEDVDSGDRERCVRRIMETNDWGRPMALNFLFEAISAVRKLNEMGALEVGQTA